jgi:hypothetical protein
MLRISWQAKRQIRLGGGPLNFLWRQPKPERSPTRDSILKACCGTAADGCFLQFLQWRTDMADNTSKRGKPDRSRISLSEDYEVRYWTQELGVSKDRLAAVVSEVGNNAEAVRQKLRK